LLLTQTSARHLLQEFAGTFFLVFSGVGSIVLFHGYRWQNFGTGLCFGGAVVLVIVLFGKSGGAVINPAVSLALGVQKRLTIVMAVLYSSAQVAGAYAGAWLLSRITVNISTGVTRPRAGLSLSFILEALMTASIIFLAYFLERRKARNWEKAMGIGGLIFLEAWLGGPYTGASMNPARSAGPALLANDLTDLWLYIAAPCLGASFASLLILWRKRKHAV
jgi:aquaporin NIP